MAGFSLHLNIGVLKKHSLSSQSIPEAEGVDADAIIRRIEAKNKDC